MGIEYAMHSGISIRLCTEISCCLLQASTKENWSSVVCEQQRHRPACASAQTDQYLCYSRFVKYYI